MLIASSVVFAVPSSAAKDDPKYYTYYFGSEEDPEEFYFELAIVSYTGIVDGKRQNIVYQTIDIGINEGHESDGVIPEFANAEKIPWAMALIKY